MRKAEHEIIVSTRADKMLNEHIEFLGRSSFTAAEQLISDFGEAAASLSTYTERYPVIQNYSLPAN